MAVTFNASTSSGLVTTADNSGQIAFQSNGTQFNPLLTAGTSQASTSGTSIDFTSIPSWVKRITVMFSGVSTNGTSFLLVQLGTSSGATTSGYVASGSSISSTVNTTNSTAGFIIRDSANATDARYGNIVFTNLTGNNWTGNGVLTSAISNTCTLAGGVTLSGTLDRVRITTVNGTDTFDAGTINILYE